MGNRRVRSKFIQIPSRPLSLHEVIIQPGPDDLLLLDEKWDDDDWNGAELRVRLRMLQEHASLVTDDTVKLNYPGAYSCTIERIITPQERIRSSEITKARSLRDKLTEFAKSIEKHVDEETLALADETEREAIQ